jgi:hypothetical protein
MNNTLHTTGPERIDTAALGRRLARETEREALIQSATERQRVAAIEQVHQQTIRTAASRLLAEHGSADALQEVEQAATREAATMGRLRRGRFDARMKVGNIDSAGLQAGNEIFVAPEFAQAESDAATAREINDHEVQHLDKQARQIRDVALSVGDPQADRLLSIPATAFFESDAMLAAGFENTSWDYVVDYLWPVQDIADYVHGTTYQGGTVDGPELMRTAARTGDIATVRYVIVSAYKQKRPAPAHEGQDTGASSGAEVSLAA